MNGTEKYSASGKSDHAPLFTGNPHRDTAVSPYEIAVELSQVILDAIKKAQTEKRKD